MYRSGLNIALILAVFGSVSAETREPTPYEQLSLELINRARADPDAEAARYGIDLNEGLDPGTISSVSKQPLTFNEHLIYAAATHSRWMLDNDTFSHTGDGGSTPAERGVEAGYVLEPSYGFGENIAGRMYTIVQEQATVVELEHEQLFVDDGIDGRGHRKNILDPDWREVGIGLEEGPYTAENPEPPPDTYTYDYSYFQTQDFAYTDADSAPNFLTGVAYDDDAVTVDDFYTAGEGLGDVMVVALADGAVVGSTTTWASGGYSLPLPDATYEVRAFGGDLTGLVTVTGVTMAGANLKLDIDPAAATTVRRITIDVVDTEDWSCAPVAPAETEGATQEVFDGLDATDAHTLIPAAGAPINNG